MPTLRLACAAILTLIPCLLAEGQETLADVAALEARVRELLDDGKVSEAVQTSEPFLAAARKIYSARDPRLADALELAAKAYRTASDYRTSARRMDEVVDHGLAVWEAGEAGEAARPLERVFRNLHRAAEDWELAGAYPEAIFRYESAIRLSNGREAGDAELRVDLFWSVGRLHLVEGDFVTGLRRLDEAFRVADALSPPNPHLVAQIQYARGFAHLTLENYDDARSYLLRAGEYYFKRFGVPKPEPKIPSAEYLEYTLVLLGLNTFQRVRGYPDQAEASLERTLGQNLPWVRGECEGLLRSELGLAKLAQGKFGEAERQFETAVERFRAGKPSSREPGPECALALTRGVCLGRPALGLPAARELADRQFSALNNGFDYQDDRRRLVAMSSSLVPIDVYLTLATMAGAPAEEIYRRVAAWKGIVFSRSTLRSAGIGGEERPSVRTLREMLLRSKVGAPTPQPLGKEERVEPKNSDIGGKESKDEAARKAIDPAKFAEAMPPDSAFIDYFVYHHYLPPDRTSPAPPGEESFRRQARVLAFVVRPGRPVACVPLPLEFSHLERLLGEWRNALGVGNRGGAESAEKLTARTEEIARAIWKPLAPHLGGARRMIVSPDMALWRFPFAVLPDGEGGRRLIESHPLVYALSARQVFEMFRPGRPLPAPRREGVLLVGEVEYGPVRRGTDQPPLAGAAEWVARVESEHRSSRPADDLKVLRSHEANGKRVIEALGGGFREVILYCHGPVAESGFNTDLYPILAVSKVRQNARDSWLRSEGRVYLPLAGSNGSGDGSPDKPSPGDIVAADMRGTRVLWHWGCMTSAGSPMRAEGIFGFPRSFLLSGCQSVLTSFLPVPTERTGVFAELVHAAVWRFDLSPGQALRAVQRYYLRAGPHRADPSVWAPWVLIGDPRALEDSPVVIDDEFEASVGGPDILPSAEIAPRRSGSEVGWWIALGVFLVALGLIRYWRSRSNRGKR